MSHRSRRPLVAFVAFVAFAIASCLTSIVTADELLCLTTDFSTGSVSTMAFDSPWTVAPDLENVCPDAVVRQHGGLVYVVNRIGCDNIQVLDPNAGYATVLEFSVGAGMNPQDIVFVGDDRAYVSSYETSTVFEVDPHTGAILDTISLSDFADADGIPELHRMYVHHDRLFVQVQRLARDNYFEPVGDSYLAVVDLNTNSVVDLDVDTPEADGILLAGSNPNGPMEIDLTSGNLLVPVVGSFFSATDGGVDQIHLGDLVSRGMLVTEEDLGGNLLHYTQWSGSRGYAIISDDSFRTCLVAFAPTSGNVLETVHCTAGFDLADVVSQSDGYVYLADRSFDNPGVRVYDADSGSLLSGPISVGLPPFEFLVRRSATSDVAEAACLGCEPSLFGSEPQPNPSRGSIRFRGPESDGAIASAEVFDAEGRRVATVRESAGWWVWQGRDDHGRAVPAGSYWLRVTDETGRDQSRRVTLLK